VWVKGECHEASNKKSIDVAYIPYARVQDFLKGEQGDLCTPMEWNIYKNMPTQKDVKNPQFGTTSGILGMYHMKVLLSFAYYLLEL
jgi:hypothetical protein